MLLLSFKPEPLLPPRIHRVHLGRGAVRMAQHGLDRADVRPAADEMGGKGMPQGVRRDVLCNPRLLPVGFDNLPEALAAHGPAAAVGKQQIRILPL